MDPCLNTPDARQAVLGARLARGQALGLSTLAEEFAVSVDTIRRDLSALESQGLARRVRGGAMPVLRPSQPLVERDRVADPAVQAIAAAALPLIEDGMVVMLDGGTTVLALAQLMPALPAGLVVTPSPAVALATMAAGTPTVLVGGRLSPLGGISVGQSAVEALRIVAADLCCLGACGLDAGFGLSADLIDEAEVKQAMIASSNRSAVLTGAAKLGRRARHRVAPTETLDILVTDADPQTTAALAAAGMEIRHG